MKVIGPIYDPGSSKHHEDGAQVAFPFVGVFDGVSAPFSPTHPPKLFGGVDENIGFTGGEMTARVIEAAIASIAYWTPPYVNIRHVLRAANATIAKFQQDANLSLDDTGKLAGATFAAVKIGGRTIMGVQGGDVFVLTVCRDGRIFLSNNQVHGHDTVMNAMINRFKEEIATEPKFDTTLEEAQKDTELWRLIIDEMWERFRLPLEEARQEDVNNPHGPRGGYALLNGQPAVEKLWVPFQFRRRSVETMILFTDGMVPWEGILKDTPSEEIGRWIYNNFTKGGRGEDGLRYLIQIARGIETDTFVQGYETHAEVTALALDFTDE